MVTFALLALGDGTPMVNNQLLVAVEIQELFMYWADQSAAIHYRVNDLSPEDAQRAPAVTRRKAQDDWRVSRVLLREVRQAVPAAGVTSLSHSHGHALCGGAPAGWALGVDLERMRARDVVALAAWVCSEQEATALAALSGQAQLEWFYLLWTLKEAFIKAAGLDFPADMATVGLEPDAHGAWRLRAPPGAWRGCGWRLGNEWMASAVWLAADRQGASDPASDRDAAYPPWRAMAGCNLPALTQIGIWFP